MNARVLTFCVLSLAAAPAAAQFAPGTFSKAHADIGGLTACTKCHQEGSKHDNGKCLDCHKEIASRVARDQGYHARLGKELCASCHREHRGATTSLIEWVPSKRAFGHALTGWPLQGKHRSTECGACHEARRIVDADVSALVKKSRRETFLGLASSCERCHFDEHRGQLGDRCEKCHDATSFDKAPLFSHNKDARFPLLGRHKKAACDKCHLTTTDDDFDARAFPAARTATYRQFKDVPHASCASCHDDAHRGQFGKGCARCHSPESWRSIKQASGDTGFHDKTDFALRGEHTTVACKACHGPSPGRKKAIFKGLKHAACTDCHLDAHGGQLADAKGGAACDRCHQVTGFVPVQFDLARHKETRWPLEGAHGAVACNRCHTADAKLAKRATAAIKKDADALGRRALASAVRLDLPDAGERCEACHKDPHAGQFKAEARGTTRPPIAAAHAERGCRACHQPTAFADLLFRHDDSAFPLAGKHQSVACGSCHGPAADAPAAQRNVVVYRPLGSTCAGCHADEHLGQLAKDGVTDCARCHDPADFVPARFNHDDPAQTRFALVGKHKDARCAACHVEVDVGDGGTVARYQPTALACAGCHDDEHRGSFDAFVPDTRARDAGAAACDACHTPAGFAPAAFDHARTGFPLRGRHRGVACDACHGSDYARPVAQSCGGCHQDPHAQEFGLQCASCHTENGFNAPLFAVDAHRRTRFPLAGRHGALPCQECHVERRDRGFARATTDCNACHAGDALRATALTVNHQRAPFTDSCRRCHEPVAFAPARLPEHDACFPVNRGAHAGVRCTECHVSLSGAVFTGTCATRDVRCTECHVHTPEAEAENHLEVRGYVYLSARCASCHRAEQ
ncbi:MAG: hypothetical protein IT383_21475 [Deltaproteobacteria bacterium]|nr:hypothetical protein [Deltaproteobacteria bacterium]